VFAGFFIVDLLHSILKGSDDGVLYLINPRVWTFSIVLYLMTGAEPAPETLCFYKPVTMEEVQKHGFIK
jgi:hypothetical protein